MYIRLIVLYNRNDTLSSQKKHHGSVKNATKSTEPRAVRLIASIVDLLTVLKLVDSLQKLADAFHLLLDVG